MSNIASKLKKIIHIEEIEQSTGLQLIAAILTLDLFLFFSKYSFSFFHPDEIKYVCWPLLQGCSKYQDFMFINNAPDFRGILLALIYLAIGASAYFLYKKDFFKFYWSMLGLFVLTIAPIFIFAGYINKDIHNPEYVLFFAIFLFLFTPKYRFFYLQILVLLTYFLSSISKIGSDSWIYGPMYLKYVPPLLVPFFSNGMIFLQIFIILLLTHKITKIRLYTFFALEIFHLYTATFIPIYFIVILSLLMFVLFYEKYEPVDFTNLYKSKLGLLFVIFYIGINLLRLYIPGDDYLTGEGSYFSLNMFQSYLTCTYSYENKNYSLITKVAGKPTETCNPYNILQSIKDNCSEGSSPRSLKIDNNYGFQNINIVNVPDYCKLTYSPISHNDWIKPVLIKDNSGNLDYFKRVLKEHRNQIQFFYYFMFYFVLTILFLRTLDVNLIDYDKK